jgi:WD40 repeat protein
LQTVAFGPDSLTLAIASRDGTALIANGGTGKQLDFINWRKGWHSSALELVAISPDGARIAAAIDSHVEIWETPALAHWFKK